MLASFPASMLNQNTPDLGILNRLKLDPSRSSGWLHWHAANSDGCELDEGRAVGREFVISGRD
jgi:hypothetical protein